MRGTSARSDGQVQQASICEPVFQSQERVLKFVEREGGDPQRSNRSYHKDKEQMGVVAYSGRRVIDDPSEAGPQ
jgi:hypothetical protein